MITYQNAVEEAAKRYHFPIPSANLETEPTLQGLSYSVVGPVLLSYVWWILKEAHARKLKRLFFLARDGYVLREIAICLCKQFSLDIECKYLYCSRVALRTPTYWFLGEEAFDLLLQKGYHITINEILSRVELSLEEYDALLKELDISLEDANKPINEFEFSFFVKKLRENQKYRSLITEKSRKAFAPTIGYLRQEGLFESDIVAIVDSGWIGSMQRSLRQLLQQDGWSGQIIGFYFGMLKRPKDSADGEYLTWYFNYKKGLNEKIKFCNNLFECMLSAPHGTTLSYIQKGNAFFPICKPCNSIQMNQAVTIQIKSILEFVHTVSPTLNFYNFDEQIFHKMTQKLLYRLMYYPTTKDNEVYSSFVFSDDIANLYEKDLITQKKDADLRECLFFYRAIHRLFKRKKDKAQAKPFWIYGAISYFPKWKQSWYRINIYLWELLKNVLNNK